MSKISKNRSALENVIFGVGLALMLIAALVLGLHGLGMILFIAAICVITFADDVAALINRV